MPVEADYLRWLGDEADQLAAHLRQVGREVAAPAPANVARAEGERLARAVDGVLPPLTEVAEALRALGRRQHNVPVDAGGAADPRRQALSREGQAEEASRRGC